MLSSDTPITLAPAALNLSMFSENVCAWMLQPCVNADG